MTFLGLKTPTGGRFKKGMTNVGAGFGGFLSGAVINPFSQVVGVGSDLLNSPFTMLLIPIIGVVVVVSVVKASSTANTIAQNPDSIRAVASAVR